MGSVPIIMLANISLFLSLFLFSESMAEEERAYLDRANNNCTTSQPFYIKNRSPKAKKPYLTVDEKTRRVGGGKSTGEENQQWVARHCDSITNVVNVATGGCLTKKKKDIVVTKKCKSSSNWSYDDETGTMKEENTGTWARMKKKKSAVNMVSEIKYLKGTQTPWAWFQWDIEYLEPQSTEAPSSSSPPYKLQPEDPGCYTSDCPPGCQLVLIARHMEPRGGLYYGIPTLESHVAVTPNTRLYKSTAATTVAAWGRWAATYYMFHHKELNMWVIGEGEEILTNIGAIDKSELALSGNEGLSVVPEKGSEWYEHLWTWNDIMPLCLDDNTCRSFMPDETSRSLMHESYPFSENRNGKMVTQFTYKGETYEHSQRTDSEGAIIYATRGVPMDLPIAGLTDMKKSDAIPKRYRVFSFSDRDGFLDIEDFDPSLAVTNRLNEDRHLQTAAIHTGIGIPLSAGLADATSWELRMDITVTHSTNATYFKTVGWGPGGYSGIQQTPDTRRVPSGKNFIFSMWDTTAGGVQSFSYVDQVNEEANVGGKTGVLLKKFAGEGTGQQMQIDYPWAIGDKSTIIIHASRATLDSDEWCVTSGLAPPGKEEVWLATFCRKSPQDPLSNWGFGVFIEDWLAPSCFRSWTKFNFKKQRAAIFSNWKVVVDGNEVVTEAPSFAVNVNHGYARGLTDAGFLSDKAFYLSTGGWKYDP